jgi:hypothetical protein
MLAHLEPIVRERIEAEAALDAGFARTQAIVVADATTMGTHLRGERPSRRRAE